MEILLEQTSNKLMVDLVKTYRIPLDIHPRLLDLKFTMDRLPGNAFGIYTKFLWFSGVHFLTWRNSCSCVLDDLPTDGYDRNDVERLCVRLVCLRKMGGETSIYGFMTLPSWGDAKVVEESHHFSSPLLERVPSHTTVPTTKGAMISLPTTDEIVASILDLRLTEKSKGPALVRVFLDSDVIAEPSWPLKKRELKKKASEVNSSALELGHAEGMNEADLTDFCAEIKDSLEKDESISTRAASTPIPCLGKRLGAPPSMAIVSATEPSHVGTLVHASTSGRSLSLGGVVASGDARKSGAHVLRCQVDPLDFLARSALAHDVEYDQVLEDDFGTATRGEEIDLTLFPLTPSSNQMSYPYEDLANHFNVLSALLVSRGVELNSRYTGLVKARNRLQEKFDRKKDAATDKVKELQTELPDARVASIGLSEEFSQVDAKLSDQVLVFRDLQNQLVLEKARSQGYKDDVDGLREEVTWFIGSVSYAFAFNFNR
nr:hypothetical protein [Tanacetum cinerariifolium]